eukprot:GHUV01003482.1.p1 GENE.GHUV01003482.1~~GHUV01003482.1.p1  ORF type:complete len:133 (+),score=32.02 GHUV01003482.1:237-635(+)
MHVSKASILVILATCAAVVAFLDVAKAVQIRDEDEVKFIQDLPDTRTQTFVAAAAAMDDCPEPQVNGKPKTEWPELVGKTPDEAKAVLERDAPGFKVQVLGPDMMATMEWNCKRIRLWLDKSGKISRKPIIG